MILTRKYKTSKKRSLNITKKLIKSNKVKPKFNHSLTKTRATSLNKLMMTQKNQSTNYTNKILTKNFFIDREAKNIIFD